ncbi:hypothetical protein [Chitinophaga filiformis]|uniref:Uncharacterized protein n=1 Tax=Chitinophaga filiformis TaxID=104663 RepID=A0ABY4HS22_CHIFI|nr:hypothetical protein [Chitinophaga filiformis]UPK66562.1 hypothetical protein MYF79_16610 [Chitinophaga filiformis]
MMELKKGIGLYSKLPGINDQLYINAGTIPATADTGLYYHPGSYIPRHEWRHLQPAESKLLVSNTAAGTDFSKSIYVGEIPETLRRSFATLGLDQVKELDKVYPALKENESIVKQITEELEAFLRPLSASRNYKFHRITRAMPNRETITCHYIDEQFIYIGLHIDQSKRFTPHTAYRSGNRISINLSKENRWLAFINLSMRQVVNMLREKMDVSEVNPDNIAYYFFQHYSDYPALKIEIKPYQYYIAPTDNFFHDATTLGNREIDVTIVYTGIFDKVSLNN